MFIDTLSKIFRKPMPKRINTQRVEKTYRAVKSKTAQPKKDGEGSIVDTSA